MSELFAITVKKLGKTEDCVRADYETLIKSWAKEVKMLEYNYEIDSLLKLHFHGILELPKGFYRTKLLRKGYHMKIDQLMTPEDAARWKIYIRKDQLKQKLPNLFKSTQRSPEALVCAPREGHASTLDLSTEELQESEFLCLLIRRKLFS